MSSFFDRMFGRSSKGGSSSKAKERLQFILVHDRINLPPERLEEMKAEILRVISKHMQIDDDKVSVKMERGAKVSTLAVDIEIPFEAGGKRPATKAA